MEDMIEKGWKICVLDEDQDIFVNIPQPISLMADADNPSIFEAKFVIKTLDSFDIDDYIISNEEDETLLHDWEGYITTRVVNQETLQPCYLITLFGMFYDEDDIEDTEDDIEDTEE